MRQAATLAYRAAKVGVPMELENIRKYDLSWRERFWCYRNFFTSECGVLYDMDDEVVSRYLNTINTQRIRVNYTNWNDADLLKDKYKFHTEFRETHPEHIPELYGVFTPPDENVDGFVDEGKAVIKPRRGVEGQDIHIYERDGDKRWLDGEPVDSMDLNRALSNVSETVVTEYVEQAEYARQINPESTNTLRILTMIDPETDEAFIAAAVHRFGTSETGHVDNWSAGGLSAGIDPETGQMYSAAVSPKITGRFERVTEHPDTEATIVGTEIPAWEVIRDGLLDIAGEYSNRLKNVGWDVIVTDHDGSFKIIEGNAAPGIQSAQTHEPLLSDERVVRFYKHYGVI